MSADEELANEAVRVYRRYAIEIVEGLTFCPYAERTREQGKTKEIPILEALPTDEAVLLCIEEAADDPRIEIGLVLFPRLELSRSSFGRWVEVLRKAHTALRGGAAALAIEGFHPDAEADLESPDRLTPFVRRTPDPTLQLTRLDVLERVRRGSPTGTAFVDPSAMNLEALLGEAAKTPLSERIARANHEQVARLGVEAVRAKMDAILRDRDERYARIDPGIVRRLEASSKYR